MSTLINVRNDLKAKVILQTNVSAALTRPYRRDEDIPQNAIYAYVYGSIAGHVPDSNVTYTVGELYVEVIHKLNDPTDEETYTLGKMWIDQELLMRLSFWRNVGGVHQLIGVPELTPAERVGNCIVYKITCQVSITP